MAKAHIRRPDGTQVDIDGSPQEIAELIQRVEGRERTQNRSREQSGLANLKPRSSLPDLLATLIDGGFFKEPKELAAVKQALAELGHVFPVTTLSPALLRFVRRRLLRRLKQDNRWLYTG